MSGMQMTREELIFELEQKERQIEELTRELAGYRSFFHGRKIAVSAEVASTEGNSNGLEHQKDRRTFDIIESALLANEFLCQLEQFQIDEMINAMQPMMFAPDQWIIRQGEFGSKLYVLEEGKVQVTKDSRFLRVMEAPCVFGELAILYHCERTASIKSLCNCRVWALERRIFHAVMVNTAKSKHDEMVALMTKSKLQKMFSEEQIDLLADSVKDEEWGFRAEVDQSHLEGKLYLVVSGQITQRRNSSYGTAPELKALTAGDILGDFYGLSLALSTLPANPALHSQIRGAAAAQRPTSRNNNVGERYFVDSVEGARLIIMLVEQICRTLDNTSLIDEPSVSQKSTADIDDVELADLKTVATLGIGGFGRVNLVKHFDTEKVYALKIMNKAHVKEMNQQEHVLNERNILISCRCDFIVRLYKTFRDAERLYMLLEYCPGGEVWTMLRNWGRFDELTARFYCAAALEAFDYLHRRCVIYRDLKPENMLLDKNGIPKLADFGFAKRLKSENAKTWTFCGTAEYVAPEIILNKGQDTAVDIWSLGIFMYELISGTPPFASTDPMHTYNSILKGVNSLAWPRYISDQAKSLICKFCRKDPAQRLGYGRIEDARKDVWFQGFDFVAFRNHTMRPPIRPKIRNSTDTQNFDRYPSTDNFSTGEDETGWDADF